MPIHVYREQDANLPVFVNTRVAVVGYGNQGRAQALNLRDSRVHVVVGQRPGSSWDRARADDFHPRPVGEAVREADLVILTLPDEQAPAVFEEEISPALRAGQALGFAHGFNVRFGFINAPADVDVVLVAPKGPGSLLRSLYVDGKGLPALLAVHQDATGHAKRIALAWAMGIGCARAGVVETTFASETETDLFGEQVVLCGGVPELMHAAFETLVEAGFEPEFAYLECIHELKQIVDLVYARGLQGMREQISNTARFGGLTRGQRLVPAVARQEMKRMLEEIRDGRFAREWMAEHRAGSSTLREQDRIGSKAQIEHAGEAVRRLMPWLAGQ